MDVESLKRINPQITADDGTVKSMSIQYNLWKKRKFDHANPMIVATESWQLGLGHIENLPIVLKTKTIVKCHAGKKSSHFIPTSMFTKLREKLEHHLYSIESKTRKDSILLILNEVDYKKDPIVVSIALNQKIHRESVHIITSIYGRREFEHWVERSYKEGCKRYENVKKERSLQGIGVQFSRRVNNSLSNDDINREIDKSQDKEEQRMEKSQFEVFITNLQAYNEGNLLGEWVGLPADTKDLQKVMRRIQITPETGYFMTDYKFHDNQYLKDIFGEFENLPQLNMIATLLEKQNPDIEKMEGYINLSGIATIEELGNAILQQDKIAYFPYQFDGIEHLKEQGVSVEELYGYNLAEANGIYQKLLDLNMENYVDYERYGSEMAINGNVDLLENGYIGRSRSELDLEAYSMEELFAEAGISPNLNPIKQLEETAPRL